MNPFKAFILSLIVPMLVLSCGPRGGGIKTITETRVVSGPAEFVVASSAQRFGYEAAQPAPAQPSQQGALAWDLPPTWKEKPASGMRLVDFAVGPAGEVECYVIVMNGDGGGKAANINRWRGQMGQEPLSDEAVAALPQLDMLGRKGSLVEITGEYTGMSGQPSPGFMMVGAVCLLDDSSVFVKMTGPEAAVRAESERFKAFCASLRFEGAAQP